MLNTRVIHLGKAPSVLLKGSLIALMAFLTLDVVAQKNAQQREDKNEFIPENTEGSISSIIDNETCVLKAHTLDDNNVFFNREKTLAAFDCSGQGNTIVNLNGKIIVNSGDRECVLDAEDEPDELDVLSRRQLLATFNCDEPGINVSSFGDDISARINGRTCELRIGEKKVNRI